MVLPGRPIIEANMTIRHVFDVSNSIGSMIVDLPLGLKFELGLKEMITRSNSWALSATNFGEASKKKSCGTGYVIRLGCEPDLTSYR